MVLNANRQTSRNQSQGIQFSCEVGGDNIEAARDSVRQQVEMVNVTRKEIKRLVKIQNKHAKLLKKLKEQGLIQDETLEDDDETVDEMRIIGS